MSTQFWRDGDGYTSASAEDLSSTSVSIQMGRAAAARASSCGRRASPPPTTDCRAVSPPSAAARGRRHRSQQSLPPWSGPRSCPKCPPPFCRMILAAARDGARGLGERVGVPAADVPGDVRRRPAVRRGRQRVRGQPDARADDGGDGPARREERRRSSTAASGGACSRATGSTPASSTCSSTCSRCSTSASPSSAASAPGGSPCSTSPASSARSSRRLLARRALGRRLRLGLGLVGACWADLVINYCARCTLKESNWISLLVATALNVCIGLTPWVDNFMHMAGFVAGLVVGCVLFEEAREAAASGGRRTCRAASPASACSRSSCSRSAPSPPSRRPSCRSASACEWCQTINCVEISWFTTEPWWSLYRRAASARA